MGAYKPLKISGMETGLVQSRENFLLPDDAYPVLENAYVWRERIKRRQGLQILGRLRRKYIAELNFIMPDLAPTHFLLSDKYKKHREKLLK